MAGGKGGGGKKCVSGAVSSMKLASESTWTALLSRWFHSIVVLGKKVFVLGNVAEWDICKHLSLKHTHTHMVTHS